MNYAKFVAQHFRGRITHYEVWNEENSWGWYGSPPDPKAFGALLRQWLANMEHLKAAYPYLYSLEVRRNPFASNSVVFRD